MSRDDWKILLDALRWRELEIYACDPRFWATVAASLVVVFAAFGFVALTAVL